MIVYYVPPHANGDLKHRDVERGIVVRETNQGIFVRFHEGKDAKLCNKADLK